MFIIYLHHNLWLNFSISARIGEQNMCDYISCKFFEKHFARTRVCCLYTFYGIRHFSSSSPELRDRFQGHPKWFLCRAFLIIRKKFQNIRWKILKVKGEKCEKLNDGEILSFINKFSHCCLIEILIWYLVKTYKLMNTLELFVIEILVFLKKLIQ